VKGVHILLPVAGVHVLCEGRIEAETLGDRVGFPNDHVLRRPNAGGDLELIWYVLLWHKLYGR
jgi:hypothetical protein